MLCIDWMDVMYVNVDMFSITNSILVNSRSGLLLWLDDEDVELVSFGKWGKGTTGSDDDSFVFFDEDVGFLLLLLLLPLLFDAGGSSTKAFDLSDFKNLLPPSLAVAE